MKHRLLPFAAILIAAFVSCQQNQPLEVKQLQALGQVELTFDLQNNSAKAAFVSSRLNSQALLANQTSVSFVSSQFQVFTSGANRFLVAKFNLSNTSGAALTDLALVAYRKSGNQSNTAISNLLNFQNLSSAALDSYALAIKPAHAMTNATTVNSAEADTQFFTEAEVTTLQAQATSLLTGGDYLFPYGYIARATGSTTSRSVANGANTGTLTVGVKLPGTNEPSSAVNRFTMTFIAFTQPTASRVSESLEEQGTTTANARKTSLSATELFALGGSSLLSDATVKRGCVLRTAGTAASPTAKLVDTFTQSFTPTANAGAIAVSADTTISLDRNGNAPTSANWRVRGDFVGNKAGVISGGGSSTLTFNPNSNFEPGELVTVTTVSDAVTIASGATQCVPGGKTSQFRAAVGAGGGTFGAKSDFASAFAPLPVFGDVNGDGRLDLVTANFAGNNMGVALGNGTGNAGNGTFATQTTYTTLNTPTAVALGDLDNDNDLDAVVSSQTGFINVLLNNGFGVFGTKADFTMGATTTSVTIADFNSDGNLDVATPSSSTTNLSVRLGNGAGSFSPKVDYTTGTNAFWIASGDVNNDGKLDLVTPNSGSDNASVLLGIGDGTFGAKTDFTTGTFPNYVSLGDLNNDGNLDMVVANGDYTAVAPTNDKISVLLGTGTGTFGAKNDLTTGTGVTSAVLGDLNGNGRLSIVTANRSGNSASVLIGNGAGSFAAKVDYTTSTGVAFVTLGDLNNDNKLDIAVGNYAIGIANILLHQ